MLWPLWAGLTSSVRLPPVSQGPVRVAIVDDHEMFAEALTALLVARWGDLFDVRGHTTDAAEAASLVRSTRSQVALVDLTMPAPGGVAAIRHIKASCPGTKILALSDATDCGLAVQALRAGADSCVSKAASPTALVEPLRCLSAGARVLDSELIDELLKSSRSPSPELLARLGTREMRLWTMLATGAETAEIARRMVVSERTAKRVIASLLTKIGATNRVEAAGLAGKLGLLDES